MSQNQNAVFLDLGPADDAAQKLLDFWGEDREDPQETIVARAYLALRAECHLLAKLAADTPQFSNPLEVWAAQAIRDRHLATPPKATGP